MGDAGRGDDENPFFSVISPLLSRSLLLRRVPHRRRHPRVLASARETSAGWEDLGVDEDALDHLVRLAGGDARRSLTYLEAAAGAAASQRAGRRGPLHGRDRGGPGRGALRPPGDQHYDITSAFIKSVRAPTPTRPCTTWAWRGGEDPRFIARRLIILASEDIGSRTRPR